MPKKVAVIIRQQFHSNRQSITTFVRFKSAQQALAATGILFQEQHISVNLLTDSTNQRIDASIFVDNFPFGIEDEARKHSSQCCTIKDVRIIQERTNGLGKGFGYVNIYSSDAVKCALRLNESDLNSRSDRLDHCECKKIPTPKAAPVSAKDKTKRRLPRRLQTSSREANETRPNRPKRAVASPAGRSGPILA
jgi:RNA recognition motif-containing protein